MTELEQLRELLCRLRDQAAIEKRILLAQRIGRALAEVDRQIARQREENPWRLH